MVKFLSGTTIVLSTLYPLSVPSQNDRFMKQEPMILKEYVSPTMNYDPIQEYHDRSIQKIMDRILLESVLE